MKTPHRQNPCAPAFTLLEVVIVLAITALVLSAVYSLAQGTLTLADDVRRAERRDTRMQAFTTFCEHLFTELPATARLNLRTTQDGGQYLTEIEFENAPSPFDGTQNHRMSMYTETTPGGALRLCLSCQPMTEREIKTSVVLFEDLAACEWRSFDSVARQWTTNWNNTAKPRLIEFSATQGGNTDRRVFWITPNASLPP